MATDQQNKVTDGSVLLRKTRAGQAEHQARAMSVQKSLRVTLAKAADDLLDMAMAALSITVETVEADALEGCFEDDRLLMMLDGPRRLRAAATFDPLLVGALIQQQTMGRVLPDTAARVRRLTATDAMICAPFLDRLLARAAELPEAEQDRALLQGFRFGARAEERRLLLLALEEPSYQVIRITVDIAGGLRQGQIVLCLPSVPKPTVPDRPAADPDGDGAAAPKVLNDTVMRLNVDLNIALARLRLPLGSIGTLAPGTVLPLGAASFEDVQVTTLAGRTVGQGVLGQIDGRRAVQLVQQGVAATESRRRASDRDALDQPQLGGGGIGGIVSDRRPAVPDAGAAPATAAKAMDAPAPQTATVPDMPDMSDMSDLPELDELPDLPPLSFDTA